MSIPLNLGAARPLFRPHLVAADLDGTLLPADFVLPPAVVAGVAELRQAGVSVVVTTGRMFQSARRVAAELGLTDGPIICYQGAVIADLGSGEWLFHKPLPSDLAAEVVRTVHGLGRHVNVFIDDRCHVAALNEWARLYMQTAKVDCTVDDDLVPLVLAQAPTKIVVATSADDVERLLPELQRRWQGTLYVTRSQPQYIEISHVEATKSRALVSICERFGVRRERVAACGDGLNDIDMLQWAGLGVAVAEAEPAVLRAADLVVPRADLGKLFGALARAPRDRV